MVPGVRYHQCSLVPGESTMGARDSSGPAEERYLET